MLCFYDFSVRNFTCQHNNLFYLFHLFIFNLYVIIKFIVLQFYSLAITSTISRDIFVPQLTAAMGIHAGVSPLTAPGPVEAGTQCCLVVWHLSRPVLLQLLLTVGKGAGVCSSTVATLIVLAHHNFDGLGSTTTTRVREVQLEKYC